MVATTSIITHFTPVDGACPERRRRNWRNLPAQMIAGSNTLQYAYDADGNRVKKNLTTGVETHYVRGANGETIAVYENDVIEFHNILAGSEPIGSWDGSQRRYFLKDHLGSVRTTVDQNGTVDGYDDYYPFGLTMPTRQGRAGSLSLDADKFKFTGHEHDDDAGLTLDYMMARNYDPIVGRFLQIDPHHHNYPGISPYAYVLNNPMYFVDPDGRDVAVWYTNEEGERTYFRFNGTNQDDAPDNEFVQQFLEVYNHVSEMEGFKALVSTVWNSERTVNLVQSEEGNGFQENGFDGQINWNPERAIDFGDRVLSPATLLGHEFEHSESFNSNKKAHIERRGRERSDGFNNDEEYRVLTGPEIQMARQMGEIDDKTGARKHKTKYKVVKVSGPTSNKAARKKEN